MGEISYTQGRVTNLPSIRSSSSWTMILCVNTSFLPPISFTVMTICSGIIAENEKRRVPMIEWTLHPIVSIFYKLMFQQSAVAIFEYRSGLFIKLQLFTVALTVVLVEDLSVSEFTERPSIQAHLPERATSSYQAMTIDLRLVLTQMSRVDLDLVHPPYEFQ